MIEVIQQSSNFMHRHGDTHAGSVIRGGPSRLSVIDDLRESVKLGFFLALFLVHIILYMLHRSYKVNLSFALFCLMWFLRTGETGGRFLFLFRKKKKETKRKTSQGFALRYKI